MSGCGSGNGRTLTGEGRVGLARAWLLGGAQSVIATYWPTLDDPGAFIESFYRFWREPAGPASAVRPGDALRKAQIDMIRSRSWRSEPRHWASHFLITTS
jgi:CHAT domain-containing protein